jgi:hypothetical protein
MRTTTTPRGGKKRPAKVIPGAAVLGVEYHDLASEAPRFVSRADTPEGTLVATRAASLRDRFLPKRHNGIKLSKEQRCVYALPKNTCYGIALSGIVDPKKECARLLLQVHRWNEPDWGAEDKLDETPETLELNCTAMGLELGAAYLLLRFDDPDLLPKKGDFYASKAWSRAFSFIALAPVCRLMNFDQVPSDGAFFYRLVRAPADT